MFFYEERLAYRLTWVLNDKHPDESLSEFQERIIKAKRRNHKIDEEWINHIDGRAFVIDIDPEMLQPVFFSRDRENGTIIVHTEFLDHIYEYSYSKRFVKAKIQATREIIGKLMGIDPKIVPSPKIEKDYFEIQLYL